MKSCAKMRFLLPAFAALLLGFAATAPAKSTKNVVVVNPSDRPVPTRATGVTAVRNVNAPALQPFQARLTLDVAPGTEGTNGFVAVPAGKRLVIEYASAYGDTPAGQTLTFSIGTKLPGDTGFVAHDLPATQQSAVGNTGEIFVAGSMVRLYADSPQLLLRAERNAATGTAHASLSISDYLVALPQ